MSVRVKLITVLTTILVGTFISLSLFNYNVARQSTRNEIINSSLPLTRDNIYSEIQAGLMRPIFVSSLMANDTFLKDWAADGEHGVFKIRRYLNEIQEKYGFFSAFFVSEQTGKYYYSDGILKTISPEDSHDVWYYKFVNSGKKYALDVDTNEARDNLLTIFINHRLENHGELLGVTGVGLKMDNVARLLKSFSRKYNKTIFLTDAKGIIQAHHDVELIENVNIRDLPGLGGISSDILDSSGDPATYEYEIGGDRLFLTARYVPELEWTLIVEQNERTALGSARDNFIRTLLFGAGVTLLIVVLSVITINHFQLRLERQANTDELTGLANRRAFEGRVNSAIAGCTKNSRSFSIILMDLDGFKQVNDVLGHVEGDLVLKRISAVMQSSVRENDFCARWGGDEFIILVDDGVDQAVSIAERIRMAVGDIDFRDGRDMKSSPEIRITVSCGVVRYSVGDSLDSLTRRADRIMYVSKESGKNRVMTEQNSMHG